ncbi:MAG TPA: NADP-dependent isocitrate dehydrogenase, partial [Alphaproteobacteria bacterium]|nr:NADP-dependent isocitrate dehydrogenase [Alphaproteobacteria bacterium]
WRLCQTKSEAIENWASIASAYAAKGVEPVVFWLDKNRPHDARVIEKITRMGLSGIDILSPEDAMTLTLSRLAKGENTIAATGNLVGDHITDYFPIMEIASSAKMLSVIKLLRGGLVAETGSGGTAPDLLGILATSN